MHPPADVTAHADKCFKQILREGHQAVYSANKEDSIVVVDLWDFAGQHLYYASHPVFLSPRALYVVVHNLSKPLDALAEPCVRQGTHDVILENPNSETNLDNLLSWLVTVHQLKPRGEEKDKSERQVPYLRPPVIIVGTHADQPFEDTKTMISQIEQRISGEEYAQHVIRPLFSIDNTQGVLSGDNAQSNMSPWEYWTKPMKNLLWTDPQAGRVLLWKLVINVIWTSNVHLLLNSIGKQTLMRLNWPMVQLPSKFFWNWGLQIENWLFQCAVIFASRAKTSREISFNSWQHESRKLSALILHRVLSLKVTLEEEPFCG